MNSQVQVMKKMQSRTGNVIVVTMFCLILVMFIAALVLDVGLIGVDDRAAAESDLETRATVGHVSSQGNRYDPPISYVPAAGRPINEILRNPVRTSRDSHQRIVAPATRPAIETQINGNAVRAVLESLSRRDRVGLSFGRSDSSSVWSQPRDIVFVVDLSGSMNDDTESAWATESITAKFAGTPFADLGKSLMQNFFTDMKFGSYPGQLEYIGQPLGGVSQNSGAYHQMTMNDGGLCDPALSDEYRIDAADSELERKTKAYRWMIDNQIKRLMPQAQPTPDSQTNYEFWEKYLDYIMVVKFIGPPENKTKSRKPRNRRGGPTPGLGHLQINRGVLAASATRSPFSLVSYNPTDSERGWIPPNVDADRIYKFNNPNRIAFPDADSKTRFQLRNKIGYRTYAQFLLDWGRDGKPDNNTFVQSSVNSPFCPMHQEELNGEVFSFPPRMEPMHSVRRSLIAALQQIRDRNFEYGMTSQRDLVAVIGFDSSANGINLVQTLTDDYDAAMDNCRTLQATTDKGSSTSTESGLKNAFDYLRPVSAGGVGRRDASKIVVLLTDGRPNAYESSNQMIDDFVNSNSSTSEFYDRGYYWLNAALMQCRIMQNDGWYIHPVGVGFGADYDFLDRVARIGSTAIDGQAMRGTGNPALYETKLTAILDEIIRSQTVSDRAQDLR